MNHCQQISSQSFPNNRLCQFLVEEQKIPWENFDQETTYTDLTDPQHPKTVTQPKNGTVSADELARAAIGLLEEEWQKVLRQDPNLDGYFSQPIAENLDRIDFLPPWLPPPIARLSKEEKERVRRFIHTAQAASPLTLREEANLRYQNEATTNDASLLTALQSGSALSCIGLLNPFRFARHILLRKDFDGVALYENKLLGRQQAHYGAREADVVYDYSYDQKFGDHIYYWHPITPLEQWALSLMNVGLKKMKEGEMQLEEYINRYAKRAYELAPNNYQICFNLGIALYNWGEATRNKRVMEEGKSLLKKTQQIYPSYQPLQKWKEKLT